MSTALIHAIPHPARAAILVTESPFGGSRTNRAVTCWP